MSEFFSLLRENILYAIIFVAIAALLSYVVIQFIFIRIGKYFIKHSATKTNDIIVKHLRLKRLALVAPILVILTAANLFPETAIKYIIAVIAAIITWLIAFSLISLFNGINAAYESRPSYNGVSIKGFMDILKLIVVLIAVIITVSILIKKNPLALLAGLGAITAVLILVFQNTLLSLVASVQIMSNDLLREGDFIDVPSFHANGTVTNISLTTIKVRNADMTYSHIPTYKILDTAFINWRGMNESESRRIKRAIILDQGSIQSWDGSMLQRMVRNPLLGDFMTSLDTKQKHQSLTNSAVFRQYMEYYLREREDLFHEGKTLIVRLLAPDQNGMPLEIIAFTRTTDWNAYENIQAEIFEHILAVIGSFGLRISQPFVLSRPEN